MNTELYQKISMAFNSFISVDSNGDEFINEEAFNDCKKHLVEVVDQLIREERTRTQNILMEFQLEAEQYVLTGFKNGAVHAILEIKRRMKTKNPRRG